MSALSFMIFLTESPHANLLVRNSAAKTTSEIHRWSGWLFSALALVGFCLAMQPKAAAALDLGDPQGARTVTLEGRCHSEHGGAVPQGTIVTLQTLEGGIAAQQPVDSAGSFQFQGLVKTDYLLIVRANGFKPYQEDLNLGYSAGVEIVNVALTPLSTAVRRPAPALTDLRAPRKARREFDKGRKALEGKNAKAAERYLQSAVKIYPCYARAQTDLGLALSAQHHYRTAEKALRKAIQCDPGFVDSYTMLGQLLNAEKRYTASETVLENGLRLSPGAWQFYAQLGTAEFGQEKYKAAAEQFQRAERMTPPPPADIHVKLANAYVKMESFEKAYTEMADYLRADPHGPFAPRIRQIMRQMRAAGAVSPEPAESHPSVHPRPQ